MLRILFSLIFVFALAACETMQTNIETHRPELNEQSQTNTVPNALKPNEPQTAVTSTDINLNQPPSSVTGTPELPPNTVVTPPKIQSGDRAKVGLILGPGGIRAYAHIGVLQELLKAKVPVISVVGFETGALVGGIYSAKGQMYDVEWQMMKLHEEDFQNKSLMAGSKPQDVRQLSGFLQTALGSLRAEDAKVNFACPSYNLDKRQIFMMSRGPLTSMLPFCIPFTPFYKPYQQNIAALTSLNAAIRFLKSKGVNYLIYVDLLGEKTGPFFGDTDSPENIEWSTIAEALESQLAGVNKVISVPLSGLFINDFAHRRDMSQRGQQAGKAAVQEISRELEL